MKKIISITIITLSLLVVLTGCQKKTTTTNSLNETPSELLSKIVSKASEYDKDDEYGLATIEVEEHKITKEETEAVLGLSKKDFSKYVDTALESKVVNSWVNHSIVVVKIKDGEDIKEVAEKIVKNTSPSRFGCLKASKIEGAYYGNYVIYAASDETIVDNVIKAFKEITNNKQTIITRENNWNTNFFDE